MRKGKKKGAEEGGWGLKRGIAFPLWDRGTERGRVSGRSSAGVASPDLDRSPLLHFQASCGH